MAGGGGRATAEAGERRVPSWPVYAKKWSRLHGVDVRRSAPPVRGWLRLAYGFARPLARMGVAPGLVTLVALALDALVPVLAWQRGWWVSIAGAAVLVAAVADTVDGALAVLRDRFTRINYVYDGLASRLGESCWLLALWFVGSPAWLVVAAGTVMWLHEYARARAAAAGATRLRGLTVGDRATRVTVACLGLAAAGAADQLSTNFARGTATLAATIWLLLGLLGLLQLFGAIRRVLRTPTS